jgi:hypothetical protein
MSSTNRSPQRVGIEQRVTAKGVRQFRGTAYDKAAGRHLGGRGRSPWQRPARGAWTPWQPSSEAS